MFQPWSVITVNGFLKTSHSSLWDDYESVNGDNDTMTMMPMVTMIWFPYRFRFSTSFKLWRLLLSCFCLRLFSLLFFWLWWWWWQSCCNLRIQGLALGGWDLLTDPLPPSNSYCREFNISPRVCRPDIGKFNLISFKILHFHHIKRYFFTIYNIYNII